MNLEISNVRFAFVVSLLTLFPIGEYVPRLSTVALAQTSEQKLQDSLNELEMAQIPDYEGFGERVRRLEEDVASLGREVDTCEVLAIELEAGAGLGPEYEKCLKLSAQLEAVKRELEQVLAENTRMNEFTNHGPSLESLSVEMASLASRLDLLTPRLEDIESRRQEQAAQLASLRQDIATLQDTVENCQELINNAAVLSEKQRQQCEELANDLNIIQKKHDALSSEMTDSQGQKELVVLSNELYALDAVLPLDLPEPPTENGDGIVPGEDELTPLPDDGPRETGDETGISDGLDARDDELPDETLLEDEVEVTTLDVDEAVPGEDELTPLPDDGSRETGDKAAISGGLDAGDDELPDETLLEDEVEVTTPEVIVSSEESRQWWLLMIAAAILSSVIAYWTKQKRLRTKAEKLESFPELTVQFEPHFDPGIQRIPSPRSLKLDFNIKFLPSMKAGAQTIKAPNGLVIATKEIQETTQVY